MSEDPRITYRTPDGETFDSYIRARLHLIQQDRRDALRKVACWIVPDLFFPTGLPGTEDLAKKIDEVTDALMSAPREFFTACHVAGSADP